jgi:transporter family-2 protein
LLPKGAVNSLSRRLFFIVPAGIAGALMAVQGGLNSLLAKTIGLLDTTFSVHLLATLSLLPFIIYHWLTSATWDRIIKVPWYLWLGGPIGIAITYGVAVSFPRLGAGRATTSIIVCQLITAFSLDHFGFLDLPVRPLRVTHLIGVLLLGIAVHLLWKK